MSILVSFNKTTLQTHQTITPIKPTIISRCSDFSEMIKNIEYLHYIRVMLFLLYFLHCHYVSTYMILCIPSYLPTTFEKAKKSMFNDRRNITIFLILIWTLSVEIIISRYMLTIIIPKFWKISSCLPYNVGREHETQKDII